MQNTKKIIALLLFVLGCSTSNQVLDPKIYYVRDLRIEALGIKHYGVGTIGYRRQYKFKVKSYGKMSTLLIKTCHRQIKEIDVGKRESVEFTLSPALEGEQGCNLIRFSAFDEKKGKHGEGMLLIRLDDYKLQGTLQCNGRTLRSRSSSICQSKVGLFQKIVFDRPVLMVSEDPQSGMEATGVDCDVPIKDARKEFIFQMPRRECQFIFVDPKTKQMHYMFTSGHEQMLIRN